LPESPNKFIEQIQTGNVQLPKKEPEKLADEEKEPDETEEGFIFEDDTSEVEDLFDKHSQRSRASSFTSEKGFEFGNDDEDDDDDVFR
jgi:hypothetical protein